MSKVDRDMVVSLSGPSGNAFNLLGIAKRLSKQLSEYDPETYDWEKIEAKMQLGDYDDLLDTFREYFGEYVTIKD